MTALKQAWGFLKLSGNTKVCDSCNTEYGNVEGDTCMSCGGRLRKVRG